jgi:Spy/CpxP family protein refolding chaperone
MRVTRTKLIVGALALVAALTLSAVGLAQQGGPPPGGPGRHGPGGGLGPIGRDLNLTDAQKAQIKQIEDSFRDSTKSLREQLRAAGGGPLDGLTANFDEAAARAAAQQRASIQVELEVQHAKMMSQIYALLTDDQKAKVAALKQKFAQMPPPPPPPPPSGDAPGSN